MSAKVSTAQGEVYGPPPAGYLDIIYWRDPPDPASPQDAAALHAAGSPPCDSSHPGNVAFRITRVSIPDETAE